MIGSNVQVPIYQPRIPISGGGGASMYDMREKRGDGMEFANILMKLQEAVRRRKLENLQRQQSEEMFPLQKELMQARIGSYRNKGQVKPRTQSQLMTDRARIIKALENEGIELHQQQILEAALTKIDEQLATRMGGRVEPGTPEKREERSLFGIDWLRPDKVTPGTPDRFVLPGEELSSALQPPADPNDVPLPEKKLNRQEHLAEYKRLGGSRTPEGRAYADKYLQ